MEKKTRSRILGACFYFAVLGLTLWYIFRDKSLNRIFFYLSGAKWGYAAIAVAAVVAFILGEAVVLCYLLRRLGTRASFGHCSLFSFIGFFYSAITPSASGGQPMQVVYMRRDGIPVAVSTVVLVIVAIVYKLVLVIIGIAVAILRPAAVMRCLGDAEALIYLGVALNVIVVSLLLLAIFRPALLEGLTRWLLRMTQKIHTFRNPEKVMNRVQQMLEQYRGTADFFIKEPKIIFNVFLITFAQRVCLFSVAWFTYLAFGLSGENALTVMLLYAMISVAVDMLPLPGGMGISETLFAAIFAPVFGPELVIPGMIVCRGISYYTQLLLSGVMTGYAQFFFRRRQQ